MRSWLTWQYRGKISGNPQSVGCRVACVCDASALPSVVLLWYRVNHPMTLAAIQTGHHQHPGLVTSAVMMIVCARALIKVEQAVRAPESYRWDIERALRWFALLAVMALAIGFLD